MGQSVRQGNVVRCDLDVLQRLFTVPGFLRRPLVLVQQRDTVDQGQVLFMITAGSGSGCPRTPAAPHTDSPPPEAAAGAGRCGACVKPRRRPPAPAGPPGSGPALLLLDRRCLLPALVDGQHHAAIEQLLIDVDGRGGEEQHYRAFHPVFLGDQLARLGIFAGTGNGQFPWLCRIFRAYAAWRTPSSSAIPSTLCLRLVSPR